MEYVINHQPRIAQVVLRSVELHESDNKRSVVNSKIVRLAPGLNRVDEEAALLPLPEGCELQHPSNLPVPQARKIAEMTKSKALLRDWRDIETREPMKQFLDEVLSK